MTVLIRRTIIIGWFFLLFCTSASAGEIIYASGSFNIASGASIIVAPFQNLTKAQGAGDKFSNYIAQALAEAGSMRIVREDQFNTRMSYNRLKPGLPVDRSIAQLVGGQLGIRYVVFGSVVEYSYELSNDGSRTIPIAGIDVRILDVNSGRIIFAGSFIKEGSSGTQLDSVAMDAADAFQKRILQ